MPLSVANGQEARKVNHVEAPICTRGCPPLQDSQPTGLCTTRGFVVHRIQGRRMDANEQLPLLGFWRSRQLLDTRGLLVLVVHQRAHHGCQWGVLSLAVTALDRLSCQLAGRTETWSEAGEKSSQAPVHACVPRTHVSYQMLPPSVWQYHLYMLAMAPYILPYGNMAIAGCSRVSGG